MLADNAAFGAIIVLPTVSYLVKGGASCQIFIRATPDHAHVDAHRQPSTPHSRARVLLTTLSCHIIVRCCYGALLLPPIRLSTPGHWGAFTGRFPADKVPPGKDLGMVRASRVPRRAAPRRVAKMPRTAVHVPAVSVGI